MIRTPMSIADCLTFDVPNSPCRRCRYPVEHFGLCVTCSAHLAAEDERTRVRDTLRREIPLTYAECVWGSPELKARVNSSEGTSRAIAHALQAGNIPLSRHAVVIIGASAAGKSSLAAAWLRRRIEAGSTRARFIAVGDLVAAATDGEGGDLYRLAVSADDLVLDGLGAELSGAPASGGLAAMRIDLLCKLFEKRYQRGRYQLVTCEMGRDKATKIYGSGIARRVFDGAAVINLGGK